MWPVDVTFFNTLFLPAVVGYLFVLASASLFLAFDCRFLALAPTSLGDVTGRLEGLLDCGQILWA